MKIFVVGGKAGSGKGEVARFIKEFYIYKLESCVITEYSKYLKNFATEMTEWDAISYKILEQLLEKMINISLLEECVKI